MEETNALGKFSAKKLPRSTLLLLIFLLLTIFVAVLFLVFRKDVERFIGKNEKKDANSELLTDLEEEDEDSAFGNLIEESGDTEEDSSDLLITPITRAFRFLVRNQLWPDREPASKIILQNDEILIEVQENGEVKSFKLLNSSDSLYEHNVGDLVPFIPLVTDTNNFLIQEGYTVYSVKEKPEFKFPESLESGDKIVFICWTPGCSDNIISWMLVLDNSILDSNTLVERLE